jgi:outer membrane translocation and assembly module TamA
MRFLRLGPEASNIEALVDSSFVRQEARVFGRWYYSRKNIRDFIEPTILYEHLNEPRYESQNIDISLLHGWSRELASGLAEFRIGPAWELEEINRGLGPDLLNVTYIESRLNWLSHDAEYFSLSPRDGARLAIDYLQTQEDWGTPFTASRVRLQGATLFNLFGFDPPFLIFGLRYSLGTTWTQTGVDPEELPLRLRFYAGGFEDLRGFARQSLPRTGTGALTEAILGLEARAYRLLFQRLDPFVFLDIGRLGLKSSRLDEPVYLSPGFGLRWESAFGIFRGFIARGAILRPPPGTPSPYVDWQAGLSLGEEF